MSRKILIKLINGTIVFVVMLVLLQSVFVALKSFLDVGNSEYQITAFAEERATIKNKPLYDIMSGEKEEERESVEINTKEDVVEVFNNYFKSLVENGGYSIEGSSVVVGTASVLGGITAYQASYFYNEANSDGSFYFENGTAEIAGPNGKSTGYGMNLYVKKWINGTSSKSQTTSKVAVNKDKDTYILTPSFEGTSIVEESKQEISTVFKFDISEESIMSCSIDKRAFAYVADITISSVGLKKSIDHIKKESSAIKEPIFNYFKVSLTFNRYGEVITIITSEEYVVTVNRPIVGNVSSLTKDNCAYIIRTPKTGFQSKSED